MVRGTWLVLAAGAGAGVWLAAEHGWLAWLVLSAAAAHAVGVLAYCLIVRQQTGRHCRQHCSRHCQCTVDGTVWHCRQHCQCTVTPTVTPTVPPTVLALSDSAVGGHRRIVRGQLTVGQGSGAVGNGGDTDVYWR
jgi:hypothetical protein